MATIRSYTTIEQSRKLAEILPLESADMFHFIHEVDTVGFGYKKDAQEFYSKTKFEYIPCWSLAALLEILDYLQLSKDKLGSGKEGWMVSVYPDNCRYDSCWHDNPVDACYEMILKLHEQSLL